MCKRRSDAQKSQSSRLSKLRKTDCDLANSGPLFISPVPKTRCEINKKKSYNEVLQLKATIEGLESSLRESRAQIASHDLEMQTNDLETLKLQAMLEASEKATRRLDQESRNAKILLKDATEDVRKAKKRVKRLVHERELAKEAHALVVQTLLHDHQMAKDKYDCDVQTLQQLAEL